LATKGTKFTKNNGVMALINFVSSVLFVAGKPCGAIEHSWPEKAQDS
jgi:hypothetical protein